MGRARSRRRRGKSGGVGSGGTRGGNSGSGSGSGKGSGSGSGKGKGKSKNNRARQKLNKKIQSKKLSTKVKSVTKAVAKNKADAKNKTISASQSRRQVRQKTKDKIATRKKINMPSLGQVGRTLRNIRQPVTALSNMAINSVMGNQSFATSVASAIANSKYASNYNNTDTPDRSKMTPQQIRHRERMSEKTGVDYFSPRKEVARINLSADSLAGLGGFRNKGWYKGITSRFPGVKNIRVNKTFYGRDRLKGWHSSQRPGRGHGLRTTDFRDSDRNGIDDRDQYITGVERGQPIDTEQIPPEFGRAIRGVPRGRTPRMGPEPDWLSSLYTSHNINQGKLDQGARDYWTNEAKTKGRDAVMQSIIGTSKAQGTYGGRKKPRMKKRNLVKSLAAHTAATRGM